MLADDGYLTRKQGDPLDVACVGVEDDQVRFGGRGLRRHLGGQVGDQDRLR